MTIHPLEPDDTDLTAMGQAALDLVMSFIDGLPSAPAVNLDDVDAMTARLLRPPAETPGEFSNLLETFRQAASQGVETAGPRYLAYVPGGGLVTSALAEFLARAVNRYTGVAGLAPALVAMEEGVLRWLCREFGLPGGAAGLTTTGGSLATLTALVAARHHRLGDDLHAGTLYVTAHTHHCVAKAARIAGFRADQIRLVPTDANLRMDVATAARLIAADRRAGLRPFLLVGTAGTTDTGAIDPLADLAELARREELWYHVDGAYGGCFQLTARGRARLVGIEAADSIALDPHKGFFLSYGTGILLAREAATLRAAFADDAHYLQDLADDRRLPDYADLGPELTRDFRGLRLWLPFHLHGLATFRATLDEKLDLAAAAYRLLSADPRLELPWPPELTVVAFRVPGDDATNQALLDRLNATKRLFLSSTRVEGRVFLRLCVLSHRVHAEHVEEAVAVIRREVANSETSLTPI
jgi:aromatic-L-amino-acid decarboxylase